MAQVKMNDPRNTRVADLQPGQYADGSALHDIQYLECKLILKTDAFTSPAGFKKYGISTPAGRGILTAAAGAIRYSLWLAAALVVSGCASFDFGGSERAPSAPPARGTSPAVVGSMLTRVPVGESLTVLSNRSGAGLRLFITAIDDAAADISAVALVGSQASCAATGMSNLTMSGQSVLLLLEDGCALRISARGTAAALLRLQVEAAPFGR